MSCDLKEDWEKVLSDKCNVIGYLLAMSILTFSLYMVVNGGK